MPTPQLVDNVYLHALNAKLDYAVDLADPDNRWLATGETISGTPTVTSSDPGVTISSVGAVGGTKVVAWIKCTIPGRVEVLFSWVTSANREDSRTLVLDVGSR